MLALLYDIEANLPALDAVLAEAERAGVDSYLVGGDAVSLGPWPTETLAAVRALPRAIWLRGNGERWLLDPPEPDVLRAVSEWTCATLGDDAVVWLTQLPEQLDLNGVSFCHGSPLADDESFGVEPSDDDARLLADVSDRTICFGHTHVQFRRSGPGGTELVNPGSVGLPWDGDPRAAWACFDGNFDLRRTEYDVERAVAGAVALGTRWGERLARSYRSGLR